MSAPSVTYDQLLAQISGLEGGRRHVLGIAGAPGSGKSTLVERLADDLNASFPGRAAILPMDGYHFDDRLLEAWGKRARKGSPDTFDVGGLVQMVQRLKANAETQIAVPVFDRDIEIARAGARMIDQSAEIILVEGNYLLLDESPWSDLSGLFDLEILIDVDEAELARRLEARWVHYGLDANAIRAKLEENDLPNGRRVMRGSRTPDYRLSTD